MQDCRRYTAMNVQLTDGRQHVFQWETGRYIKLVDVASCPTVNFFNPKSDEAYIVQTKTVDGVIQAMIPNELLQLDSKIKLYCVGVDSNGDFIQIHAVIPLIPRQRPANYVYEPSDIMTFESVLAEAKGYRDEAASSASAAKDSEDAAEASKSAAESAAETATQKAVEASSDADTASAKAEDAADSAADALADRKLAERYAKGTENGTPVSSGTGYEDNAKYYKEQAESIVVGLENEIELGNKFFLDDEGYLDQI